MEKALDTGGAQVTTTLPVHWCQLPNAADKRSRQTPLPKPPAPAVIGGFSPPGASRSHKTKSPALSDGQSRSLRLGTAGTDQEVNDEIDRFFEQLEEPPSRLGTAGSAGRTPSPPHQVTLQLADADDGHELRFLGSAGGREATLVAKTTSEDRVPSAKLERRRSPQRMRTQQVDHGALMSIAAKVQKRLDKELQDANALLAQERQRTAAMAALAAQSDSPTPARSSRSSTAFGGPRVDGLSESMHRTSSPAHVQIRAHSTEPSPTHVRSRAALASRTALPHTGSRSSNARINPTRYQSPPREDTRRKLAQGRSLDPVTGVCYDATWRLRNHWLRGLRWREFADSTARDAMDEDVGAKQAGAKQARYKDIDGHMTAKRVLRQRLAELESNRTTPAKTDHDRSHSPCMNVSDSADSHVVGVRRARLEAFQECFDKLISRCQLYSPLLAAVKREFDGLIDAFEASIEHISANKVTPAAVQQQELENLVSSSQLQMQKLEEEVEALEKEARAKEARVKELTESNEDTRNMTGTRRTQQRRSDRDYEMLSLQNDQVTMQNFQLQHFRAQHSSIKQKIHQRQTAIETLQEDTVQLLSVEAELKGELEQLTEMAAAENAALRSLVQRHCEETNEHWRVEDLERVLIDLSETKSTNKAIFQRVKEIAHHRTKQQQTSD